MDALFNQQVLKARKNKEDRDRLLLKRLKKNEEYNKKLGAEKKHLKLPDQKQKLTPGYFMQLKKSKKLIKLDPLTEEEKNVFKNEQEKNDVDFCNFVAAKLKEPKSDLIKSLYKLIGRDRALGFLERTIEI